MSRLESNLGRRLECDAFAAALDDEVGLVFVHGPAGVGKSTLVRATPYGHVRYRQATGGATFTFTRLPPPEPGITVGRNLDSTAAGACPRRGFAPAMAGPGRHRS